MSLCNDFPEGEELADLVATVKHGSKPIPIVCPCGCDIMLGGLPAPTYACKGCGVVRHSLAGLVLRVQVRP